MRNDDKMPLKPVAEKTPSKETTVWLCGECGYARKTRAEADACCVCKNCRKNVCQKRHGSRESECERCTIKSAIRHAQESIRRDKNDLRSGEEHLARLRQRKAELSQQETEQR